MKDPQKSDIQLLEQLSVGDNTDLLVFDLDTRHRDPGPIDPNRHTFYEVIFLSEAHGEIHTVDFHPYVMQPESIFFLAPGQVHSWESGIRLMGRVLRFTEICFPRPCIAQSLSILSQETSVLFEPSKELFEKVMGYLGRIQEEMRGDEPLRHEAANALLMLLLSDLEREFVKANGALPLMQSETVSQLIAFHQKEAWRIQSVEKAALVLGMSEDSLNREVKRITGLSAGAFLRSRTILEAKRMLIYLNQSASAIGEKLGFVDAAYFSRFFKRETGMSPTQFREKYQ